MRDPESHDSEDAGEDREVAELREQNDLLERDVETFKSKLPAAVQDGNASCRHTINCGGKNP